MYAAWLFFGDHFKDIFFPNLENWTSQIVVTQAESGFSADSIFGARALDGKVYLTPASGFVWKNDHTGGERVIDLERPNAFMSREGEITVILKWLDPSQLAFVKYMADSAPVTIGRDSQNTVTDNDTRLSSAHGWLSYDASGQGTYTDNASSNGTYLNGRRVSANSVLLQFGDMLTFPSGLKIVYLGTVLAINQLVSLEHVNLHRAYFKTQVPMSEEEEKHLPSLYVQYHRAPRMLQKAVTETIEIEPPLSKSVGNNQPLLLQVGPSATMILPMLMGSVFAGQSGMRSAGLVMVSTSAILAVSWALVNRRYRRKQEALAENARVSLYQQYIAEMEKTLSDLSEQEFNRLVSTYPNVGECVTLPTDGTSRLWSRMPTHSDFLNVRLGLGDVPLPSEITTQKVKLSIIDDPLRSEPERLKNTYSNINNAPVLAALRGESVVGILGQDEAVQFAQGMLMQIAALHSYHDVRIVVFTGENTATQWSWARWLPHVFASEDRQMRMVVSTPKAIHEVMNSLSTLGKGADRCDFLIRKV